MGVFTLADKRRQSHKGHAMESERADTLAGKRDDVWGKLSRQTAFPDLKLAARTTSAVENLLSRKPTGLNAASALTPIWMTQRLYELNDLIAGHCRYRRKIIQVHKSEK